MNGKKLGELADRLADLEENLVQARKTARDAQNQVYILVNHVNTVRAEMRKITKEMNIEEDVSP